MATIIALVQENGVLQQENAELKERIKALQQQMAEIQSMDDAEMQQ